MTKYQCVKWCLQSLMDSCIMDEFYKFEFLAIWVPVENNLNCKRFLLGVCRTKYVRDYLILCLIVKCLTIRQRLSHILNLCPFFALLNLSGPFFLLLFKRKGANYTSQSCLLQIIIDASTIELKLLVESIQIWSKTSWQMSHWEKKGEMGFFVWLDCLYNLTCIHKTCNYKNYTANIWKNN